jgi:hypothetical protein
MYVIYLNSAVPTVKKDHNIVNRSYMKDKHNTSSNPMDKKLDEPNCLENDQFYIDVDIKRSRNFHENKISSTSSEKKLKKYVDKKIIKKK